MNRIEREKLVVRQMITHYCHSSHSTRGGDLCAECLHLLTYAHTRLDHCPHGARKPSCRKCPVHCYSPSRRSQIREVMRRVGPRMIFIHPWSAILHIITELK